jgi:hypothetical protein
VLEDAERFKVAEVAYDPFQLTQMATHFAEKGLTPVEMRPIVLNFSEPMKELEALVLTGRFHHDGDPALAWMISNVVCHRDAKDNIYPRKERVENKIDGPVALIMALGRWITQPEPGDSVYETRGVRSPLMRRALEWLRPRLPDASDLIGIGGFVALVYGIARVSVPAAWIIGGAIAFVIGLLLSRKARR